MYLLNVCISFETCLCVLGPFVPLSVCSFIVLYFFFLHTLSDVYLAKLVSRSVGITQLILYCVET